MTTQDKKGWETMLRGKSRATMSFAALGIAALLAGCSSESNADSLAGGPGGQPGSETPGGPGTPGTPGSPGDPGATPGTSGTPGSDEPGAAADNPNIVQRKLDYGEALRTASLKLVGALPTIEQIKALTAAADVAAQKTVYEAEIDKLLADPRFSTRMIQWWRDTLRTGPVANAQQGSPSFDTAAVFAAQIVVQDKAYTELFTATTGNCPTFNNGQFQAADCNNGAPQAGVLTNPGIMAQYFANMAFRRARFVQETFVCTKYPAEYSKTPAPMGASLYTSPWDFNSITGGTGSRIDFKDTSSVICANCHTTMNHIAPLFANFNDRGVFDANQIQVQTPVVSTDDNVLRTRLTDWLPAGQKTAWRNGTEVATLPELGAAMAKDPDVARCAVNRVWNWAMSRGDIVNDLATIPPVVTDPLVADFTANGMKMKRLIRNAFTADDFVKF